MLLEAPALPSQCLLQLTRSNKNTVIKPRMPYGKIPTFDAVRPINVA